MKIGKCLFPAYTRAEVTMMILIQTYAFLLTYVLKVYLARESKEKIKGQNPLGKRQLAD